LAAHDSGESSSQMKCQAFLKKSLISFQAMIKSNREGHKKLSV
jgi:hypothetical protein